MSTLVSDEEIAELRRDFDRLKMDLRAFRDDLSGLAEDAVRTAKSGASEAKHRAEERLHAAAAKGRESLDKVEDQVALHPFMSMGAAFAFGLLIGLGLTRKD